MAALLAVNTIAPVLLAHALRDLLAVGPGNIINQSSMASHVPGIAYGITKSALNAMSLGQHSADTSELFFDDVRVPVTNCLGEENPGFGYLMSQLPRTVEHCDPGTSDSAAGLRRGAFVREGSQGLWKDGL